MQKSKFIEGKNLQLLPVWAVFILVIPYTVFAQWPVVSNVRAAQRAGTRLVDIYYDVASTSNRLTVAVSVSTNGGLDYVLGSTNFVGLTGNGVAPGTNRLTTWNAGVEWSGLLSTNVRFRVVADDLAQPSGENGMVLIPGGSSVMGDTMDGLEDARPVTNFNISAFYMDETLVTWAQWQGVYSYATNQGYTFVNPGDGKGATHPVQTVDWYDVVKWCNARSEQAGRLPVYYTDADLTVVYRSGEVTPYANWNAKGYRLPTEAEWEKAARGGMDGQRFPWGDLISETNANYYSTASDAYDLGPSGYNPIGSIGGTWPATSPVGSFAPNAYGLYDMAGNVFQWCWDWYGTPYAGGSDPLGVSTGTWRVFRGGSWYYDAYCCRSAYRVSYDPTLRGSNIGFRCILPRGL